MIMKAILVAKEPFIHQVCSQKWQQLGKRQISTGHDFYFTGGGGLRVQRFSNIYTHKS